MKGLKKETKKGAKVTVCADERDADRRDSG